jgi:hypothetical protein
MATTYSKNSPYSRTSTYSFFLDVADIPALPFDNSDVVYELDNIYTNRPDLLAHDLYGDSGLWWVFSVRNPNTIKDPIFDFIAGAVIYVPKKAAIDAALGL